MTSIVSLALSGIQSASKSPFSRLDTNSDSKISKSEFVSGRPQGVNESQASSLFSALDTTKSGSLSEAQLSKRPQKSTEAFSISLSGEALAVLAQAAQNPSAAGVPSGARAAPSSDEIFARLDTDGNGLISKDEFVSGRPDFASEAQATEKFASIDTNGDGNATKDELSASGSKQAGGAEKPPPPPPPPPPPSASTDEIYDELDTDEDGTVSVSELAAGLAKEAEEEQTSSSADDKLLQAFSEAVKAYSGAYDLTAVDNRDIIA